MLRARFAALLVASLLLPAGGGCGGDGGDSATSVVATAEDGTGSVGSPGGTGETSGASPFAPGPSPEDAVAEGSDPQSEEGGAGAVNAPPDDFVPERTGADDGPELQRPIGENDDTSAIAGFWDHTRERDGGLDVAFFSISSDGVATEYDYQGDALGDGADCYRVTRAMIASRGDGRYDIQRSSTLPGSDGIDDVLIAIEDDEIVFRYLGDVFDPAFGEGQSGITERFPAASDRTERSLNACET